jgi:antirestriction protein
MIMEGHIEPDPTLERHSQADAGPVARLAIHATNREDAEPEPDTYPWHDAAIWHADGGQDDLGRSSRDTTHESALDELFGHNPDAQCGSTEDMGWCGLLHHAGRPGGVILNQNRYGRRWSWTTDTDHELAEQWQRAHQEHAAYLQANREGRGEPGTGSAPQIWVCSLADYNAGILHGAWLDASLEPSELAGAAGFIVRNSHEPDAEEYGVFDYDGLGYGLAGLLGEWPNLAMLSKIAQGVTEHGEAFAAWAAYVGPEQPDQLDRFEDHYLGEWDSMLAYAENLLEECEADRIVQDAPDWLRPYLSLDVEGYARDLGFELHVVDRPDGGVWVFDPQG